jgi:hypothetical protein
LGIVVALAVLWSWRDQFQPIEGPEAHIAKLRQRVEQQRSASTEGVKGYAPKNPARYDDLSAPLADLLRQLPGSRPWTPAWVRHGRRIG